MTEKKVKVIEVEEKQESFFSSFLKSLKEAIFSNMVGNIKEKVKKIERKIFRSLASFIFFLLGMIFLLISLIFLLNYYLGLNFAWGFLIASGVFISISVIFRWLAKRD